VNPDVHCGLAALTMRLLHKDPAARCAVPDDVLIALADAVAMTR
jgi:hypothetical protein